MKMSISEQIQSCMDELTRSERQLAESLLDDFPVSGLGSMAEIAEKSGVSTPTVLRMVRKIGFPGFPEFQASLKAELAEVLMTPSAKRNTWRSAVPDQHIVNRYSKVTAENQRATLESLDITAFDALCERVADPKHRIFIAGGRVSSTLAHYLYLHLQMIRPDVRLVPTGTSWPANLLDIRADDLLIVFDIRRYQNDTLLMAQMAKQQSAQVALMTDQWRSPIHQIADFSFGARTAVPSAWDSNQSILLLIECLIAAIQETTWEMVKSRTDALEAAFDQTKLFRRFV